MSNIFLELAAPGVQKLQPYLPGKPVDELERELGISGSIKLASNENPLGPSEKAIQAIKQHAASVHFYPDGGGYRLSALLADKCGIDASCVTLGNGSNDILEMVARAFLTPDTSAVYSEYSFAVYPLVVQAVGAKANVAAAYPESHDVMPLGHNTEAMLACVNADTRVMFIANPNNPTGTWLELDALKKLLQSVPAQVIVVLDLAYNEYMNAQRQPDIKAWLSEFPNLVVTCTFSKIYALAGLRIGYAFSNPDIADLLNRVRQPFNTNLLAQEAAIASLEDDAHVQQSVALNQSGKDYLQQSLAQMSLSYLPTMGNFIAVNLKREAMPVYDKLLKKGVIVRPVANYNMPEYIRVTIGTEEQNRRFVSTLSEIL